MRFQNMCGGAPGTSSRAICSAAHRERIAEKLLCSLTRANTMLASHAPSPAARP